MSETMPNVAAASVATACAKPHVNAIFDNLNNNNNLNIEDKYAARIKDACGVQHISLVNPFMKNSKEVYPPRCMATYRQ